MRELPGAIVTLHKIRRALRPGYDDLREKITPHTNACSVFLKAPLAEFQNDYLTGSVAEAEYEARKKGTTEA